MEKKLSIISHKKAKSLVEKTAAMIFRGCAIISVLAVVTITGYMIISGTPAIFKEGITGILFSIIGIIVLALMFLLSNLEAKAIWIECVNIFAWVFLWEAVDKLFIERNKLLLKISRLSSFINMKINYYNK